MLIDTTPLTGTLADIRPVSLQQVRRTADEPLFNSLMEQHHYLGYEQPVGEHLKYLVWAQGRPIACMAWSSAPRHLGSRDRYIGWICRSPAAQHPLHRLQHALPDSAVGQGSASGIAHPGPHDEHAARRLGTDVQPSGLLRRNLHRSRPFSRDLLSRGQLGADGPHHRSRQSIQQYTPNRSIKEVLGLALTPRFRELLSQYEKKTPGAGSMWTWKNWTG